MREATIYIYHIQAQQMANISSINFWILKSFEKKKIVECILLTMLLIPYENWVEIL